MSERNIANKTNLETIKMKVVRNGQSNVYIIFTNVEFIKKKKKLGSMQTWCDELCLHTSMNVQADI